jgi:trans-2,3-dihydro-3-hydroxyanthranilate isomerase
MGRRTKDFYLVDVFAESRYAGNQLAVVLDAASLSKDEMHAITREFNFSETTFVTGEQDGAYDVRIFTPGREIPFAGHPTLGTATVLRMLSGSDAVDLNLGIGRVRVDFEGDAGEETGWMHAPAPKLGSVRDRGDAAALLSLDASEICDDFPVQEVSVGISFLMVPVSGLAALRRARLDLGVHAGLLERGTRAIGTYLFCRETYSGKRDVAARMLWEAGGAREDPATGSATVCLGAYALAHGYLKRAGEPLDLAVEQGHEVGRPSLLGLRARLENAEPRISVGGRSFLVGRGELL